MSARHIQGHWTGGSQSPWAHVACCPPVANSLVANKEQRAKKKKPAQLELEAKGSLLTHHKAREGCWGLTGKHHCFLCGRGSQAVATSPVTGAPSPSFPTPAVYTITSPRLKHPACWELLPDVLTTLLRPYHGSTPTHRSEPRPQAPRKPKISLKTILSL